MNQTNFNPFCGQDTNIMKFNYVYTIVSLSEIFLLGWGFYALSVNQDLITIWLAEIHSEPLVYNDSGVFQPSDKILLIYSILVSLPFLSAIFSSLFLFPLAETYGRKSLFLVMIAVHVGQIFLFVLAKPFNSYIPLIFSRLILGIGWGISANVIVYFGEISTIKNEA